MVSARAALIFNGPRLGFYVPFMVFAEPATFFNGFRWGCERFMVSTGVSTFFFVVSVEDATFFNGFRWGGYAF